LQQSLRNQEQAFINFFEGGTSYTSFKRKHGTRGARHTKAALLSVVRRDPWPLVEQARWSLEAIRKRCPRGFA